MQAVAIIGYPGAGKSVSVEIAEEIGYNTISMGDTLKEKADEECPERIEKARRDSTELSVSEVYGNFATEKREQEGFEVVAKWCTDKITEGNGPYVIDGMRSTSELKVFETVLNVDIIHVYAPAINRFEWITNRGRDGEHTFTIDEFIQRDRREQKWGLNELINESDITINNVTDIATYKEKSRSVISELYEE